MSLQAILTAISARGEDQTREIEQRAATQAGEILSAARIEAQKIEEAACADTAAPAIQERARIIHRARLACLQITGETREKLVDEAIEQTRERLAGIRKDGVYPATLHHLLQEALAGLAGSPGEAVNVRLVADPRDRALLEKILLGLGLDLPVSYELECAGGLSARSEDGRVVVINTLEARLARATPYLRRYMAALFEEDHRDAELGQAHEERYV